MTPPFQSTGPSGSARFPPPDLGQRFEALSELGGGGMGVVYRAFDRKLGREVAIKTLAPGRSKTALERVWREARAAVSLHHPGVVVVHDCLELPAGLCLVQELLESARPLSDAFHAGLPLEARLALVLQVAQAMAHAHREGVVHRDLKPANVLVDREGRARVLDFGLAWHDGAQSLTASGALVGTPYSMAPEQFGMVEGSSRAPAVDVWALGILLYEAICLRPPFEASSLTELIGRIGAKPLAPREHEPGVSPAVEAVCLRALRHAPRDRYADAGAMAEALEAALEGRGEGGGHTRKVALLAALVLLTAAGLGYATLSPSRAAPPIARPPAADPDVREAASPPEASLGWELAEGQTWSTTYGFHAIEDYDDGRQALHDMQYALRFNVLSVVRGLATLQVDVVRIRFATLVGPGDPMVLDTEPASPDSPYPGTIRVELPSDAGFTLRMELPSGRVQEVSGASALKVQLLDDGRNLKRVALSVALVDLDDARMAQCLNLLLGSFPSRAKHPPAWERTVDLQLGGAYPVALVVTTRSEGPSRLALGEARVVRADPRLDLRALSGFCALDPGAIAEARADLDLHVSERSESRRCQLSFFLGGTRPDPREAVLRR